MPTPGELIIDDQANMLIEKGTLTLTVKVETKEQANEIIEWMYSTEKPFKTELIEVAWDKQTVPSQVVESIRQLQAALIDVQI